MTSWSTQRQGRPTPRRVLERAHDALRAGTSTDAKDTGLRAIRPLVADSWRRSLQSLTATSADTLPPLDLDAEALAAYRAAHPLGGVLDMIRTLLLPGAAEESGVVVAVGDEAGRLLWVEGDHSIRSRTGDMGFVEGANWSERVVGTSAPGTALELDRTVQILGAEHFNRLVHPWSCTATPVHDPETRRILGVIDVTGGTQAVTAQAQLLVDATARAVEGELLVARLRARAEQPARPTRPRRTPSAATRTTLRVLGRDRALLEVAGEGSERVVELSTRHAELLLMLQTHRQGLSAERLSELVYGEAEASALRPEMVRLRKVLADTAPHLTPQSRPYRLGAPLETDAAQLLSLLDRGAHRVALAAYRGDVLPGSRAPGVEDLRATVRQTLRDALLAEASADVLLAFADTEAGADDPDVLRLALRLLPDRSPRRASVVARIERLELLEGDPTA